MRKDDVISSPQRTRIQSGKPQVQEGCRRREAGGLIDRGSLITFFP